MIENVTRRRTTSSTCDARRRHGVALRARRARRDARLPLHRRGGPGVARRRARDGHCARNVVLLGDPQQLAQVLAGHRIPRAAGARCSSTCSATRRRSPPDRGVFLERTFRLHPDVCRSSPRSSTRGGSSPDARHGGADDAARHGPALHRGRARGQPAGLARGGRGACAPRSSGCSAAGRRALGRDSWSSRRTTRR